MKNIRILPPIEKWDSDNVWLYHYEPIEGEDGSCDMEIFKMPFPMTEKVFYRRRKIPLNMLNAPQYDYCQYCDDMLVDGYWRRMHMCRKCYLEGPWKKPLFKSDLSKDSYLEE